MQGDPLKYTMPGMKHEQLKEREKVGVLVWYILAPVHLLTPDSAAFPANMCDINNQVKFLKLPTSLPSRSREHILFSTGVIIWTVFVPSIVLEAIVLHIEALTKFTQQALNDRSPQL